MRLAEAYEGLSAGAAGTVAGFYRPPSGEQIAVVFDAGRCVPVPVAFLTSSDEPPSNILA